MATLLIPGVGLVPDDTSLLVPGAGIVQTSGGEAPTPSGSILVYDEIWIREPRLMVPGMQPVGPVKIDWTNPLTRSLKRYFLYGPTLLFNELVSGIRWGRYSAFTPLFNRNGVAVKAYNVGGTSTNTVLISPESLDESTFVAVGYMADDENNANTEWVSYRTVEFTYNLCYRNSTTSLRVLVDGTTFQSTIASTGDFASVAISRRQTADLADAVLCRNFSEVAVHSPIARTNKTTYVGTERYYIAKSASKAQPAMCIMEFARYLPVVEKIDIVRNPYQFLIPA